MPSAAGHCPICLSHFPLQQISAFPCGHCFCSGCATTLLQQTRARCPHCRAPIRIGDAHPIYLELIDSQEAYVTNIVEALDQMGAESSTSNVKKAVHKIGKASQTPRVEGATQALLLKAVEDFRERVIPVFDRVEAQAGQINTLREEARRTRRDRDLLQCKLRKLEPLLMEVGRLQSELQDSENNLQEAIRLAEVAKDEAGKYVDSSNHWNKRAAELDQENKRYKDMLERQTNAARAQKEKNKKLAKQVAELTQKLAERDRGGISDATQDYDGDFSGHENSMTSSSLRTITPLRSLSSRYQDENDISLDMEAIPSSKFHSEWQLPNRNTGILGGRTVNGPMLGSHRRLPTSFPIQLDVKGHPTKAVQLGPRSIVHVGR